ncbi:MAG: GNAT family N-acetyltransferase [Acidimicrobiia bacterium]|nr:GNAT family N-acetyltransferase [Acidimicrobiia bacterium]
MSRPETSRGAPRGTAAVPSRPIGREGHVERHDHGRVRWYGHETATEELFAGLEAQLEAGHPTEVITVGEEDGELVGFHGLVDEGEFVDLLRMFLTIDRIGKGYGSQLWDHAVEMAATTHDRMRIIADPGARGFYETKGAVLERDMEPSPGFRLGVYWYDLTAS